MPGRFSNIDAVHVGTTGPALEAEQLTNPIVGADARNLDSHNWRWDKWEEKDQRGL